MPSASGAPGGGAPVPSALGVDTRPGHRPTVLVVQFGAVPPPAHLGPDRPGTATPLRRTRRHFHRLIPGRRHMDSTNLPNYIASYVPGAEDRPLSVQPKGRNNRRG